MLNPSDLMLFAEAVDSGGFTAAARRLQLPKSTISKRVAELERHIGAQLVHRSSRSFVLTDVGREVVEHARAILIEVEGAEAAVTRRLGEPSGTVRLTASVPTVQWRLAPHLPRLAATHPRLTLVVHATDRFVDIVQEGFDLAVRSHHGPLPDSGLVQRRIGVQPIVLVAAPDCLRRHGVPEAPADLAALDALLVNPAARGWHLHGRDTDGAPCELDVPVRPRLCADETLMLLGAATAGLGVAALPESFCREHLADGRLVRVLPDWTAGEITTTVLMPARRGQLPGVRAVVEFLAALGD